MTPSPLVRFLAERPVSEEEKRFARVVLRDNWNTALHSDALTAIFAAAHRAEAPKLAKAVEAAIVCEGIAHDDPEALCANCGGRGEPGPDPDRLAAFIAALADTEGA